MKGKNIGRMREIKKLVPKFSVKVTKLETG